MKKIQKIVLDNMDLIQIVLDENDYSLCKGNIFDAKKALRIFVKYSLEHDIDFDRNLAKEFMSIFLNTIVMDGITQQELGQSLLEEYFKKGA